MVDREKVIKGLECCILQNPDDKPRCGECPYEGNCVNRLKMDALSMLKAQEPIEPIKEIDYESDADGEERPYSMYYCRKCKEYIEIDQKYCDHCGQAVKWE